MKCPNCWSRKIRAGDAHVIHKIVAAFVLMGPVKCRHCFHRFHKPLWGLPPTDPDPSTAEESRDGDVEPQILPFSQGNEVSGVSKSEGESDLIRRVA